MPRRQRSSSSPFPQVSLFALSSLGRVMSDRSGLKVEEVAVKGASKKK